jgi:hypothetical protein
MKDYLTLGPVPCDEECAQLGASDYYEKAMEECRKYKKLLISLFSPVPINNSFAIKSFNHDFGTYHEVVVYFDDECEESVNYAFNIEGNLPEKWNGQ